MHECVQRSFTSTACPSTHLFSFFFFFFFLWKMLNFFWKSNDFLTFSHFVFFRETTARSQTPPSPKTTVFLGLCLNLLPNFFSNKIPQLGDLRPNFPVIPAPHKYSPINKLHFQSFHRSLVSTTKTLSRSLKKKLYFRSANIQKQR